MASSAVAAGTVNGVIAYEAGGDIYTVIADGTNKTRITDTALIETEPEYSPDGSRIALVGFPALKPDDLYVMNANGTDSRKLTSARKPISRPTWTSDGSRILFLTERDNDFDGAELYSIAPDGTGETLLAADVRTLSNGPSLSTAGDKIAYSSSTAEITVMNLDGSGKLTLAPDPGLDTNPQLSPDATRIAFTSARAPEEPLGVFSMTVAGTDLIELASGGASVAGYSPDGTRILFQGADGAQSRAKVMNADGSGVVAVSAAGRFAFPEEFSPDSQRVSLSEILPRGGEDPIFRLLTSPASGPQPKPLTKGQDGAEYGDWQPLAAPAPTPALRLEAKVGKPRGEAPQARVTCSNECAVVLRAAGRLEGTRFRSVTEASAPGRFTTTVQALGNRTLARLAGKSGRITVDVLAKDDFGQRARTTLRVTVG